MKKLLVLMLVLGLATMANAALTLTISGPSSLALNEVGTYTVGYSGATMLGSDVDIVSDVGTLAGMWNIGGGVIITTNRDAGLDIVGKNVVSGNYQVGIMNDVLGTDLGSPLFSINFTAPSVVPVSGKATISLIENSFIDLNWEVITGTVMPTKDVTIIPEPITIALLGLGGLFLRRRK